MDNKNLDNLKLYECRYEIIYYVMAETARKAQTYLRDVADDDPFEFSDVHVHQFNPSTDNIDEKWEGGCLIYGQTPDGFTLEDAVKLMKSRMKDDRQAEFPFMRDETISGGQNV